MKQKSLGLNAVLNGIKQCCSIIFPLITFPYISRVLGNDGYGKYSFSYSVTNYFILLAALGIYTYAIREGAKVRDDQKEVDKFCSQVFSINVCSAAISLLLLSIMVFCLPKFSGYKAYIFIQSTAIIMAVIGTDWVNGIFEDYFYITVRYIAVQCVCLIAMFVFVRKPEDIIPYCIISVLATNGGNLINVFYVRKYAKIRFTFDMDLKRHLVSLLILFVNSIAISIYVNSDITMLGFFESDAQVGVYSFASKIYNLLKQLINAVIVVSVPRIAYIIKNKPLEYHYGIPVADTIVAFNNSGKAYDDLSNDGVHPNDAGQEIYYETVKNVIDENVAASTGKMENVDAINADVHKFDNFIWYGADKDFKRVDDTTFTLNASASGVFGIDYTFESGDNKADIYVDGELFESPTVTFDYDFSQRHILVVSDDCTVEKEIKVVFNSKEQADGFQGMCFSWE